MSQALPLGPLQSSATLPAVSAVVRAQRLAARFTGYLGASLWATAAVLALGLQFGGEADVLDRSAALTLVATNLLIGSLSLGFTVLHGARAESNRWQDQGFERALFATMLLATVLWTLNIQVTGWMTTTVVIAPMIVCCMAVWVLRWRLVLAYALANLGGLALISALELSARVPYAPIFADPASTVEVFASWRYWVTSSVSLFGLYAVTLVLLREVKRRVNKERVDLSQLVTQRTEALREASARLKVETAADGRARASLAELDAELAVRRNELETTGRLAALGQLTATIANALDGPLDAMEAAVARARLSMSAGADLDTVRDALQAELETIQAENDAATQTIRQLRALFGGASVEAASVDLAAIVAQVAGLLRDQARLRSVNVEVQTTAAGGAQVDGDPSQLLQAVFNLLNHSLERVASQAEGTRTVRVHVRRETDWVVLDVADSGPEVTEEQRLYQTFVAPKLGGLSVGLGLAKSIADAHSAHLNDGVLESGLVVFRLVIPSANEASEPDESPMPRRVDPVG